MFRSKRMRRNSTKTADRPSAGKGSADSRGEFVLVSCGLRTYTSCICRMTNMRLFEDQHVAHICWCTRTRELGYLPSQQTTGCASGSIAVKIASLSSPTSRGHEYEYAHTSREESSTPVHLTVRAGTYDLTESFYYCTW